MTADTERNIRKQFFAYRNGMLADTLRSAGYAYKVIFGLNLMQLMEIAGQVPADAELARALWADNRCREARLIAPMLMPRDAMDEQEAMQWCASVLNHEEADVLCHRLLRHLPYAGAMVAQLRTSGEALPKYLAYRLLMNLLSAGAAVDCDAALQMVAEESGAGDAPLAQAIAAMQAPLPLKSVLSMIADHIEFIKQGQ